MDRGWARKLKLAGSWKVASKGAPVEPAESQQMALEWNQLRAPVVAHKLEPGKAHKLEPAGSQKVAPGWAPLEPAESQQVALEWSQLRAPVVAHELEPAEGQMEVAL